MEEDKLETNEFESPKQEEKEQITSKENSSPTIPLDVNFTPYNHFTTNVPIQSDGIYPQDDFSEPLKEQSSFLEASTSQFKHLNDTWHYLHAGFTQLKKPWDAAIEPNFNPLNFQDKFINIAPEYYSYLTSATSERDMDFRLQRIYNEQKNKDDIKNGSWAAYLTGSLFGFGADPINLIPAAAAVKYAKYSTTILNTMMRAVPGTMIWGGASSLGEELDKINGNAQDWIINTLTRGVFGTAIFGGIAGASLAIDKAALWEMKGFMNDYIKGIGVKLKVNEKNKVEGFQAYDMTNGTLSADKVKLAQDKLDSTFSKTALFKIPYLGTATEKFLGNSFLGSPIISMLNSKYKTLRTVADFAYDHGIITKGTEEGRPNPKKFFTLMRQTQASIRAQEGQINALHLERNGFDLSNYVAQNLTKAALFTRSKTMEILGKEIGDRPYINREQFFSEIEDVLYNEVKSPHGAVNEAAEMLRKSMDKSYKEFRTAFNLPEDWMPPRTARGYLMRVYDTPFLNSNENLWIRVISDYLRDSDNIIIKHRQPIEDISLKINQNIEKQKQLIETPNVPDAVKKKLSDELEALKTNKKVLEENLQNSIRNNPELQLLAEDWNFLSADEAKELEELTKRRDIAAKEIQKQKEVISKIKAESQKRSSASVKAKTMETAKKNKRQSETGKLVLEKEEKHLSDIQKEYDEEIQKLQEMAASGKVNRRFYKKSPESEIYVYRNPNERLELRKTYHEQTGFKVDEVEAHEFRKEHAKAYYDTILNQTADDTINQIMGKFTGNGMENHIKSRTLMIPDEILYQHKFMSKDLMAKVANYQSWLARRTHMKTLYNGLTIDGGFEPLIRELHDEFQQFRELLNNTKEQIENKLSNEKITSKEKNKLTKELEKIKFKLNKETKDFNKAKSSVNFVYEKMAGISKLTKKQKAFISTVRSATVFMNLGFMPATMITDLSANGLKHGVMPFLRSGIYPLIQSLGGMLKTKDSEAFRHGCAALNLALQHLGSAYSEKNLGLQTNPYVNMGRWSGIANKIAHASSNLSLVNFIDNMFQRITSSVAQSEVIRIMDSFLKGTISKRDLRWANKYGLDPKNDAQRIMDAFKKNGGGKTKVGGYQSNFWHWEDLEAANKVSNATFRATQDTVVSANVLDTPFWMDENGSLGIMGPIFKSFNGWAFASLNRYVIPFMQAPDASQFIGVLGMLAAGALVSPTRRMARGEEPYPPNMTDEQWIYEVVNDSAYFSYFMTIMNDANVFTKGQLLGDLKNDKYRDRSRAGLLGAAFGDVNSLADIFMAAATDEMNQADLEKLARMIPPFNSIWTYGISKKIVDSFGTPKNRAIAHRLKGQ